MRDSPDGAEDVPPGDAPQPPDQQPVQVALQPPPRRPRPQEPAHRRHARRAVIVVTIHDRRGHFGVTFRSLLRSLLGHLLNYQVVKSHFEGLKSLF